MAAPHRPLYFAFCAGGIYACYLTYGVVQEAIYRPASDGTKFRWSSFLLTLQVRAWVYAFAYAVAHGHVHSRMRSRMAYAFAYAVAHGPMHLGYAVAHKHLHSRMRP